jgi:hypothetical protein
MINQIKIKKVILDQNNERYLPLKQTGVPFLFFLTDNIPITRFGGEKTAYIKVKSLLEWYEKELPNLSNEDNKAICKRNIAFFNKLLTDDLDLKGGVKHG